jgi:phosphoglycerol geranylgeranyltransferase
MTSTALLTPRGVHLLIDPDKWESGDLQTFLASIPSTVASLIVGGTYIHSDRFKSTVDCCVNTSLPIGHILSAGPLDSMLDPRAEYVLVPVTFGTHDTRFVLNHIVMAGPVIHRYGLSVIPAAYLMLDGGSSTSAEYFTQVIPIPRGKLDILVTLSRAAQYLGLQAIYLEAGSGASSSITPREVHAVAEAVSLPILVGGGISSADYCAQLFEAGATGIIIGTAAEETKQLKWLEKI